MLIAVNPFKVLHIYGPDAVDFYRGGGETDQGDEIDVPDHDDRATRCTTAQLPQDILENRRRSLHVSSDTMGQSGQTMFKNCKVNTLKSTLCKAWVFFIYSLDNIRQYRFSIFRTFHVVNITRWDWSGPRSIRVHTKRTSQETCVFSFVQHDGRF